MSCILMFVFALVLSGAHVADAYFLSSTAFASKSVALEKPEVTGDALTGANKSRAMLRDVGDPDENMAKSGEKYKPLFENAKKSKQKEHKYPIIFACHTYLAKVFGQYTDDWWKDWKLIVGLACWCGVWAEWLIHGYTEVFWTRALHAFGMNIMILHILQYASSTMWGMFGVMAVLVAQTLFTTYWYYETPPDASQQDEFECDTLYLDLALPLEQISILFIAQVGVWWFYMTSILHNFDFSTVNYLYWLWAYLVMQMTMIFNRGADSVLGNAFPLHDVHRLMLNAEKVAFRISDDNEEPLSPSSGLPKDRFRVSKANIITRGITGFFCNAILRDIMAYTIPLMLMGFSEPMDFVVYCVGVNFICTLDDMSERKYTMTPINEKCFHGEQ